MATNNMHNLTTLIKRLEAATTRLEDIASSTIELPQASSSPQDGATLASGTSAISTPPSAPTPAAAPPPPVVQEPVPESIEEFDSFIDNSVAKFAKLSNDIGGLIAEQAAKVVQGFKEQRKFLLITTKSKKPDLTGSEMSVYQDLLKPINEALMAVNTLKESHRGSSVFNQLSAVAEGFMVSAWVTVDSRTYKHVEEYLGSAQFFGNRVLKEFKDKDPRMVEWIQSYYQIFRDLTDYVKNYFPNGVPWNPKGRPAQEVAKSISSSPSPSSAAPASAPAPSGGAPPPPPPPPPGPPPVLQIDEVKAGGPAPSGGLGAVFSELNKGESVTKGLRKVDKSEMTHKNPSLRTSSSVSGHDGSAVRGKSPAPGKKPKPETLRVKKPPKKELEGNKWIIENFESPSGPIEIEVDISHSILISKCTNTTIIIRGKANAITIENTTKLSLVVDSLISTVDAVKSKSFALQVLGTIPTVMLDQVDDAQIFFSKESESTRVFHSKSSGINLNVMGANEDYKELPLPAQICSYYDAAKGQVVDEIVSHCG